MQKAANCDLLKMCTANPTATIQIRKQKIFVNNPTKEKTMESKKLLVTTQLDLTNMEHFTQQQLKVYSFQVHMEHIINSPCSKL